MPRTGEGELGTTASGMLAGSTRKSSREISVGAVGWQINFLARGDDGCDKNPSQAPYQQAMDSICELLQLTTYATGVLSRPTCTGMRLRNADWVLLRWGPMNSTYRAGSD